MSEAATQLIDAFTALPATERRAVLVELARIAENDAGPITEDELSLAGAEVFAMYDREEAGNGEAEAR